MEAFQLSLGRTQELQLDPVVHGALRLRGALPAQGQILFRQNFGASSCNNCHFNAGANTGGPPNDINANFNTRVERLPLQPARLIDPTIPLDGGFGTAPFPEGGLGDGKFNTPPLVEAADTPPFFHNNSINTIELAVQFYEFSFSPAQVPANLVSFQRDQGFETAQIQAIAAFLRVINAIENIRSAVDLEHRAIGQEKLDNAAPLLAQSIAELEDAIEVLSAASLHPTAIRLLRDAIKLDRTAMEEQDQDARNVMIREAVCTTSSPVGMNAVAAKTAIITAQPEGVDRVRADLAAYSLPPDSSRTSSSTPRCQSRTMRSARAARSGDAGRARAGGEQRAAGRVGPPGGGGRARRRRRPRRARG